MSIQATIGGTTYQIQANPGYKASPAIGQQLSCSFTIYDPAGTTQFQFGTPVVVSDPALAAAYQTLFVGFINQCDASLLYPNPNKDNLITCMDLRWLATKRRITYDYQNMSAGDIAADLWSNYLSAEGVLAGIAYRRETTSADFNAGALTNTIGATTIGDGDLELLPAGSAVTKTFASTADWGGGSGSGWDAQNNQLNLHASSALKFVGTNTATGGNTYVYWQIFYDNSTTIAVADQLYYDVWISSTSPEIKAGVDIVFTDGTTMRDFNGQATTDQFYIHAHPGSDLKGFADDQWYHRIITMPISGGGGGTGLVGKTIQYVTIAFEGDTAGTYTAYFRNIALYNNGGLKKTYYDGSVDPYQPALVGIYQNYVVSDNGYAALSVTNATVYDQTGTWISPAINIDPAKIVQKSLISWQSLLPPSILTPATTTGSTTPPTPTGTTLTLYTSIDNGASWQLAPYKNAIPDLMAGFNVASRNLYVKAVFAIANPSPEISPILKTAQVTIASSWTQTKTDSITTAANSTDFGTGNYSGTAYYTAVGNSSMFTSTDSGVALTGYWEGVDRVDGIYPGTTIFSTLSGVNMNVYNNRKQLNTFLGSGTDVRVKFNSAPSLQDFTCQVQVTIPSTGNCSLGIAYRSTNQNNNNDTYAWTAMLTPTNVQLGFGQNGGGGAYNSVANVALPATLTVGSTYTMKVVVNVSSHKIYIDDILWVNVTDTHFIQAGDIAVRFYNNTGSGLTGIFDNFGIVASTNPIPQGTWDDGAGISLSSLVTIGNSVVQWGSDEPTGTAVLCQTSIDGGSTWQIATNGLAIPNLPSGTSVAGVSVRIKFTLSTTFASITPILLGWTIWATTATNVTGTRTGPSLLISNVGRIYSTAISVNTNLPTNTSLNIDCSWDNATWVNAATGVTTGYASYPVPVTMIFPQPDPIMDYFSANTITNYTSNVYGPGHFASWNIITAFGYLSGVQTAGVQGILLYNTFTSGHADIAVEADFSQSDSGGILFRAQDHNNFYYLAIRDGSASANPHTVALRKVQAGIDLAFGSAGNVSISFARGDFHRFKIKMVGNQATVYMDNVQILTDSDTPFPNAGQVGFVCGNATGHVVQIFSFRFTTLGDIHDTQQLYTRLTLTSIDPTVTPQILDLTIAIRNANIQTGAFVSTTSWAQIGQNQYTVAQAFDDLVTKSSIQVQHSWQIAQSLQLMFQQQTATPAPFYMWSDTVQASLTSPYPPILFSGQAQKPVVSRPDMQYRNRESVDGGFNTTSVTEQQVGDGFTQTWPTKYPVAATPYITISNPAINLDNQPALVGVLGVDTGKDFYYTPGVIGFSQDASEVPPASSETITIAYLGQEPVRVTIDNTGVNNPTATPYPTVLIPGTVTQSQLAAIDGTTGIVEDYVSIPGITLLQAQNEAHALLALYGTLGRTVQFSTNMVGLAPGQLLSINMPSYQLYNAVMLITQAPISTTKDSNGATRYWQTISASEGADVGDWTRLFSHLINGLTGRLI